MGECLVRGCQKPATVQLYVGHLAKPHRYTGIAFCWMHAALRLNNSKHTKHLSAEMRLHGMAKPYGRPSATEAGVNHD